MELSKENFFQYERNYIEHILIVSDEKARAEGFTNIMDEARRFDLEKEAFELAQCIAEEFKVPELWEYPHKFEKEVDVQPFPVSALPSVCRDYLEAVCRFVQVEADMAALPLLSTLSLCLQKKAIIKNPGNNHTEPLNLFCLTVAPPGDRKDSCQGHFIKPVQEYEKLWNEEHRIEIETRKSERACLEKQKQLAISKGDETSRERVREITESLYNLKELHEMRLTIQDITPEALAFEMYKQGEKMAVIDGEGSIFDVLAGMYSNGQVNINLLLKAYDCKSHNIARRSSEMITLNSPSLTIGLMTQPFQFKQAMKNPTFSGRGFNQRFIYAFPKGKAGYQNMNSENIPYDVQMRYTELITRLLNLPNDNAVLTHDTKSYDVFEQYFDMLQKEMLEGGIYENLKEYFSKHFGKVLRIAGILHLCEHNISEPLNEHTALNAVNIGMWAANQALIAFSGGAGDDEVTVNAKYIIKRIKSRSIEVTTKRDLQRICKGIHGERDFSEALELLADMKYVKIEPIETGSRPSIKVRVNPLI